jgi:hypothetical protein
LLFFKYFFKEDIMTIGKTIQAKQLTYWLAIFVLCVTVCGCDSLTKTGSLTKIKFRPYLQIDQHLGGMAVQRIMIPEDWKADSRVVWNINHVYMPVQGHIRAEAPDGGSWVDIYGTEMFGWADRAHDHGRKGVREWTGAIHHPNVSLPEAMVRYVIVPNRRNATNLRILGYRPVNNLPSAYRNLTDKPKEGKGICLRVQYELDGSPVDEEFYGFMPPMEVVPYPPNGSTEYHSYLWLVHSLGAKAGKLESVRPLLGFIATSTELNPAWEQRYNQIHQAGLDREIRNIAQERANIEQAGRWGDEIHARNEAFLKGVDAHLAQSRAQESARRSSDSAASNEESNRGSDDFTQYLRGTEHMQDQNGVVSDQYTDYNYHWTDGSGNFVHTNDQSLDPNRYLNGNYQQMTPVR